MYKVFAIIQTKQAPSMNQEAKRSYSHPKISVSLLFANFADTQTINSFTPCRVGV